MDALGTGISIFKKGHTDFLYVPSDCKVYGLYSGGSGRRCGGQGDILCGSLAVFLYWSLKFNQFNPALLAAYAASFLTKKSNIYAFGTFGRSLVAGDMIKEIPKVLRDYFETENC